MDDTPRRLRTEESASTDQDDRETARKTEEIRSEIAQTRADMSETIGAIQDKLRPGNIAAAATDRIKDATSRAARNVADTASETASAASDMANATMRRTRQFVGNGGNGSDVARAMIGAGIAWLVVDHWRNSGRNRYRPSGARYATYRNGQWQRTDDYSSFEEDDLRADDDLDVSARARDMQRRARQQGERAMHGFERLLRSNPLMVAAAAMTVGAAIGLALPETERENEWMGEAREDLFEHAQDVAQSAASHVREAAGDLAGQMASELVGGEPKSGDSPR